ncbi:DUF895 domain membrane protein [Aspergillus arachidicola]|uniref:DUF895 domain membrane protein n=1 Tax=Aspergillus arachidicola TaxID=656916 RepID=A0A2G7FWT9_9EURO|nr:DUF895 domain membrane protein [Aspergillus arachidicola]
MSQEKEDFRSTDEEVGSNPVPSTQNHPVKWYRSTFYNALILGLCNFLAPGIWGAMNSVGGGGLEKPYLVNAANALTFCLMVLSCFFGSIVVRYIGIKWTLIVGTMGYAPYAAGLYTNNRFGTECFRVGGQILGGAINLGINSNRDTAGSVSYAVLIVFIILQALGPFAGLLLNTPSQVQRTDGLPVKLRIANSPLHEIKETAKLFFTRNFLLIVPLISQAVFTEAVMFTYLSLWFSVRARALGSFLGGIIALILGNLLGAFLDTKRISLKTRTRSAFVTILTLQGAWWIWGTIIVTEFKKTQPSYDWADAGFGRGFALYLFWVAGFQLNYMFLYFLIGNLAEDEEDVIRISGLLRGTESAAQAVSYGLNAVTIMASVGSVYLNFGLWAISLLPAWLVVKHIGVTLGDKKIQREARVD